MYMKTTYKTTDLKLQAFLRLMLPDSFIGVDRANGRVSFIFDESLVLQDLINGYYTSQFFKISPFQYGSLLDQGKSIIFGHVEF